MSWDTSAAGAGIPGSISLRQDLLRDYPLGLSKEWLVTNGIGGYGCGTVNGVLARRYHGLLVAALAPPVERTLLLSKVDETANYLGQDYPLFTNHWASGAIDPHGYIYLYSFSLDGTTPVWNFALRDALVEKRVWMEPGENLTYIRYSLLHGSAPLSLSVDVFVNYRDHHGVTYASPGFLEIDQQSSGFAAYPHKGAIPLYIHAPRASITVDPVWATGFYMAIEASRGLDTLDDHLRAAVLHATLHPGDDFLIAASTSANPDLDGEAAVRRLRDYELGLLQMAGLGPGPGNADPVRSRLVLAADQFVVAREVADGPDGHTILAGYPWFSDWGRDTMISLPGLALSTGRTGLARQILRTYALFIDRGMLPNRFPDSGQGPEYNTVDAMLWYFEALRAYYAATGDLELIKELWPLLEDIISWHQLGTRYRIKVDPRDGLLFAGEPGVQLTWMDVKIGNWVVTPRTGKAVEINALWINALRIMEEFDTQLGRSPSAYADLTGLAIQGFDRFWNQEKGYCFDVIDGPDGAEDQLRPNQLLAVSLRYAPIMGERARSIVEACARELYTPKGLRSLAPGNPAYRGAYGGDQQSRDAAYHQGTVWAWLIGPFVSAILKVYNDPVLAKSYLEPILGSLFDHGVGSISEIFDGDAPYAPRGCIAQAWSVGEVLRVMNEIRSWEG